MALATATGFAAFDVVDARRVDLSDVLSAILKKESALIGRIPVISAGEAAAKDTTHKWPEDSLAPNSVTVAEDVFSAGDPATGADLVVAAGHGYRCRVGALLKDTEAGKTEVLQVTAIAGSAALTITRGYGSTDAEAHELDCTLRVIGSPIQENKPAAAADDIWSKDPTEAENYTQLFERTVTGGDTLKRLAENGMIAGIKAWMKHQLELRTEELKEELADTIINGIISTSAGSDTVYRSMMGIVEFLSQTGSLLDDTVEDFDEDCANAMVKSAWDEGAKPDMLVVSSALVSAVNKWETDRVRMANDEQKAGREITRWRSELGMEFPIVPDRYVAEDVAALLDSKGIRLLPLVGDAWHVEKMARTGRFDTWQMSGQYTLELRNALTGHALHTNLTVPSA